MKFIVTRTSMWSEKSPCEEAKRDSIVEGDKTYDVWSIEINTIEELIDFADKHGDIIIEDSFYREYKEIEIYDTWRE